MNKSRTKVIILIIWVLSTVLAIPMGIAYEIRVVSCTVDIALLRFCLM